MRESHTKDAPYNLTILLNMNDSHCSRRFVVAEGRTKRTDAPASAPHPEHTERAGWAGARTMRMRARRYLK